MELVEGMLNDLITEGGGTGYYDGMFRELESFGAKRALPVLIRMIRPEYRPRIPARKGDDFWDEQMRGLAIMALGGMGEKSALPKVRERLKSRSFEYADDDYEELVIAAYRLGDQAMFDDFVGKVKKKAEEERQGGFLDLGYDRLFSVAKVQNRVGERKASLETYRKLRDSIEENDAQEKPHIYRSCLYNIACLLSLAGEKAEAIEALRAAVRAGFRDREWIRKDGDLNAVRGEAAFRNLMDDKKLFGSP